MTRRVEALAQEAARREGESRSMGGWLAVIATSIVANVLLVLGFAGTASAQTAAPLTEELRREPGQSVSQLPGNRWLRVGGETTDGIDSAITIESVDGTTRRVQSLGDLAFRAHTIPPR